MGGGGGGFFSFALPVVGAIIGSMVPGVGTVVGASVGAGVGGVAGGVADGKDIGSSLLQGAVAGVGTYVGAGYLAPAASSAGTGASLTLGTAAAAGATGAAAGSMASGFLDSMTNSPEVPNVAMPNFGALKYGDGLDTLAEVQPNAPTYTDAEEEARRKYLLSQQGTVGYADTILTLTKDLGAATTKKATLLGG